MLLKHVHSLLRSEILKRPWLTKAVRMKASVLVSKFNPSSGKLEWDLQPEQYDYVQEIARSGFADMLHDEERNFKYNLALQKAISKLALQGKASNVLDIGTGTGLLAIMAARAKATSVTACETFQPMAECAKNVIAKNGFDGIIKLVPKRSTDITVGPQCDMSQKANILVTEVFDTELIGEGAIGTFNHAHKNLLTEDSIVIPSRATIFVQVVDSKIAASWNRLNPILCHEKMIIPPRSTATCPGNGAVHDLQLAEFSPEHFVPLTEPIPLFKFNWSSNSPIPSDDSNSVSITAINTGTANALFMWWTIDMDQDGDIVLSCAPPWAHPDEKLPWRDHWMQALYYLPQDKFLEKGANYELKGYHDEYSLWFDLSPSGLQLTSAPRPFCNCILHNVTSRTRLGQLNDNKRQDTFIRALSKVLNQDSVCLVLGDCSFLGLAAAILGSRKVYVMERHSQSRRFLHSWIVENEMDSKIIVIDENTSNLLDLKINTVLGEPFYDSSILPWHNIYFSQQLREFKALLTNDVKILPKLAHIFAIAVEMKDLWKIRSPVYVTQEVDLCHFDKLIENAIDASDHDVEPHPLWEYPCKALSAPVRLLTLDITSLHNNTVQVLKAKGQEALPVSGTLNGVALWIDWQLDEANIVSGGPASPVTLSDTISWDMHSKQAVHFFKNPIQLFNGNNQILRYEIEFTTENYDIQLKFSTDKAECNS